MSCPVGVPATAPPGPPAASVSLRKEHHGGLPKQTLARLANAPERLQPGLVRFSSDQTLIIIIVQPFRIISFPPSLGGVPHETTLCADTSHTPVSFQPRQSALFPAASSWFLQEARTQLLWVSGTRPQHPPPPPALSRDTNALFSFLGPVLRGATSSTQLSVPPRTGRSTLSKTAEIGSEPRVARPSEEKG